MFGTIRLVDNANHILVAVAVIGLIVGRPRHADNVHIHTVQVEGGEGEHGGTQQEEGGIKKNARTHDASGFTRKSVEGIMAYQALGAAQLFHDRVTGVHAVSAADAFHLEALADVDSRGADLYAALAIYAVAKMRTGGGSRRIAPLVVVTDDDGIVINEGALEASVGANDKTELFAKPREIEIKDGTCSAYKEEGVPVFERAVLYPVVEFGHGNKVGEEDVGNKDGEEGKGSVLEETFAEFEGTHRGGIQFAARYGVAFDPAFDPPEDMVEEDGLRAGPTTP